MMKGSNSQKGIFLNVISSITLNNDFFIECDDFFSTNDFSEIGNIAINYIIDKIDQIDYELLKKIICMYLRKTKEEYEIVNRKDLERLICEELLKLKTSPMQEYIQIQKEFETLKGEYNRFIQMIDLDNQRIEQLISVKPIGTLIQQLNKVCNKHSGKILVDLNSIEKEYMRYTNLITENYVKQEMNAYVIDELHMYFGDFFVESKKETLDKLRKMALERAKGSEMYNILKLDKEYIEYLFHSSDDIYFPFMAVKMSKFYEDIEEYFNQEYMMFDDAKIDILKEECKERKEKIPAVTKLIELRNNDKKKYLDELKRCVSDFKVINYLKDTIASLFCIRERKTILDFSISAFINEQYEIFINLVGVQIEGIFNDILLDANIQVRLDGKIEMFEMDDLKHKLSKNNSISDLHEAIRYFKFYFNNIIRNKIAHGRICYNNENMMQMAYELLLDLQCVVKLALKISDTEKAIRFIKNHIHWLEFSFNKKTEVLTTYKRILNSLNDNVCREDGLNNSREELYWIFNSYYDQAYEFANVTNERDKIREYMVSEGFWRYVYEYLSSYNFDEYNFININHNFRCRVLAIKGYVSEKKYDSLEIILSVIKKLGELKL